MSWGLTSVIPKVSLVIVHPRMALNAFNDQCLFDLVSTESKFTLLNLIAIKAYFASHTVSRISFVMVLFLQALFE